MDRRGAVSIAPRGLYRRLAAEADRHADRPAVTFLDAQLRPRTWSSGSLFEEAARMGEALAGRGLDRDRPLGILLGTQEEQVLHYLAALAVGHVPAILTPPNRKLNRTYYAETMRAVLERSDFSAVITDLDDVVGDGARLRPTSFDVIGTPRVPAAPPVPDDVSFLQFSSGTTGFKRGVLVSDPAVDAQLDTYASALDLHSDDVLLSWLPLYHDMGFIACLNMALAHGVHSVMLDPIDWVTDPSLFLRAASTHRATLSWNPNFAYAFMATRVRDADVAEVDLSSMRGLVNCSEPVTKQSQDRFAERYAGHGLRRDAFLGCYAMAETVFALTHGEPGDVLATDAIGPLDSARTSGTTEYVSVGRPLKDVELRIVDAAGIDLPERRIGEIWVRSPFNMTGYYNNASDTDAAFHGDWYRTGDLGYHVEDTFFVTGRRKDVLIVAGTNVFPQDIEALVSDVDGVLAGRVSAFSEFDPTRQTERIVVLAETEVPREQHTPLLIAIRQHLQSGFQLTGFAVHLVPPGWLVKSSSGKMARRANLDKWTQQRAARA